VLLYELLTGATPFTADRFKKAAYDEIRRIIREEEPPKPSTRLSESKDSLPSVAALRHTEPAKLTKLVRGELDWIVMKALEKDRNRRYETASNFAKDVERHLRDELVEARPPTMGYRLRKAYRKNRAAVLTAVAFAILLIVGSGLSFWQAGRATLAEAGEKIQRVQAEKNLEVAEAETNRAIRSEAEAVRQRNAAERTAASLQMDLDLADFDRDRRTSLLRLARTMRGLPEHCRELREFAAVAILAGGQYYAPLAAPLTHDGGQVTMRQLSPDCRALLTIGRDGSAYLWNTLTGRRVGSVRAGAEEIASFGFSPDGRWLFTDDWNGVVSVWNVADGSLRCRTAPRPDRYQIASHPRDFRDADPGAGRQLPTVQFAGDRLLTVRLGRARGEEQSVYEPSRGPVELWDAATGRLIARLRAPAAAEFRIKTDVCFGGNGKWVFVRQDARTLGVFSAADGTPVARVAHPAGESLSLVAVNPDGTRLLTLGRTDRGMHFRLWETERWTADPVLLPTGTYFDPSRHWVRYLTADTFAAVGYDTRIMKHGRPEPLARFQTTPREVAARGDLAWLGEDVIADARTGEQFAPPQDRRFHPELARFAPDGRLVMQREEYVIDERLLDVAADKVVVPARAPAGYVPGFGFVAAQWDGWDVRVHRVARVPIPPDLLELWLQVAVRGELGPNGKFAEWDEPTWNRKRLELASRPRPVPDFPFPGHVVANELHWLEEKYDSSDAGRERQLPLLDELVRRSERAGDTAGAEHWRYEADRRGYRPPPAPAPREVNR
jgi:hypothetical protein